MRPEDYIGKFFYTNLNLVENRRRYKFSSVVFRYGIIEEFSNNDNCVFIKYKDIYDDAVKQIHLTEDDFNRSTIISDTIEELWNTVKLMDELL